MHGPVVICIGGATVDRKYRLRQPLVAGTSNPADGSVTFGGVARNVCETLCRLGVRTGMLTLVGDDDSGRALTAHLAGLGADVSLIRTVSGARTAEYLAILDGTGGLTAGIADMAILDRFATSDILDRRKVLDTAAWIFADCNLPADVLTALVGMARASGFKLAVDAVSVAKSVRLPADLSGIGLLLLNRDEAAAMTGLSGDLDAMALALSGRGARAVVLTDGARDITLAEAGAIARIPAVPAKVIDVTGAGDALCASVIARLIAGDGLTQAVAQGARAAALTVASPLTVRDDMRMHGASLRRGEAE